MTPANFFRMLQIPLAVTSSNWQTSQLDKLTWQVDLSPCPLAPLQITWQVITCQVDSNHASVGPWAFWSRKLCNCVNIFNLLYESWVIYKNLNICCCLFMKTELSCLFIKGGSELLEKKRDFRFETWGSTFGPFFWTGTKYHFGSCFVPASPLQFL